MKKIIYIFLFMLLPLVMQAASSVPEISMTFKNTPLSEAVQKIEKKSKFTITYNADEVDVRKPISATFKDTRLNSALKRVFGKEFDVVVKAKTKTVTVRKKQTPAPAEAPVLTSDSKTETAEQPAVTTITTANADTIRQRVNIQTVSRMDTTMQVTSRKVKQPTLEQPEPKYLHCSHRIIAGAGAGYGEVKKNGSVAALGDINYAYFFNDNWGVSLGLGVDYYRSRRPYDENVVIHRYEDTDTEPEADLRISYQNMLEVHDLLTINLPIQVQMEYPLPSNGAPLWLYGSAGPRIGYPVVHNVHLTGNRYQEGYYEKWDLTLRDMHEYGTTPVDDKQKFPVQKLTIAPHAELGVAIGVKEDLAIGIGAYGNVSVWNAEGYLPWQVGAKVSVRWRRNVKPQPLPTVYETITVMDTTWTYREIVDTIRTVEYDTIHPAVKAIAQVMERSIIWFDLDKTEPKLDPIDMLDELAAILIANPDQQIEINGHTCDLGKTAYNEKLSKRRAEAVANLLIKKGVNPEQLIIHAYANSKPYYSKSHDRYLDRRVEIIPVVK